MTLGFDEETALLESYDVVFLMHAPARRRSTDRTCLFDPGGGARGGGWLVTQVSEGPFSAVPEPMV